MELFSFVPIVLQSLSRGAYATQGFGCTSFPRGEGEPGYRYFTIGKDGKSAPVDNCGAAQSLQEKKGSIMAVFDGASLKSMAIPAPFPSDLEFSHDGYSFLAIFLTQKSKSGTPDGIEKVVSDALTKDSLFVYLCIHGSHLVLFSRPFEGVAVGELSRFEADSDLEKIRPVGDEQFTQLVQDSMYANLSTIDIAAPFDASPFITFSGALFDSSKCELCSCKLDQFSKGENQTIYGQVAIDQLRSVALASTLSGDVSSLAPHDAFNLLMTRHSWDALKTTMTGGIVAAKHIVTISLSELIPSLSDSIFKELSPEFNAIPVQVSSADLHLLDKVPVGLKPVWITPSPAIADVIAQKRTEEIFVTEERAFQCPRLVAETIPCVKPPFVETTGST